MIKHTVIFRLRRNDQHEQLDHFVSLLLNFAAHPPHALDAASVHVDLRLREEGPSTSDALMEVIFPDEEAFQRYLIHPKHEALVNDVLIPFCDSWLSIQSTHLQ